MGLILLKSDRQFKITKMEFNKDQSKDNVLGKKTYSGGSGYSAVLGKKICRWRWIVGWRLVNSSVTLA